MAALDPDNCIKLFKLDDSQDSRSDPETAIIPAQNNMFQAMFHPEARDGPPEASAFPDEGVSHLIEIRIELEELFHHCGDILGISDVLWEDISRRLFDRGFNVGGRQCADKWNSLYTKYVEVAKTDDEARVSAYEHFAIFEQFFKLRTNHVDSKILEDITQFLSSRFECTTAVPRYIGNGDDSSKQSLNRGDFSNLSQEEHSQMLDDAINAAQKMLDDNLKEDYEEVATTVKEKVEDAGASRSLVSVQSDRCDFCWDADSEQCFMDLRLYAESSRETKRRILRDFHRITAFVVQKMLLNGYRVTEDDCRKKWSILIRAYNKEGKGMLQPGAPKSAKNNFWLMDKVLKKYAPEKGQNFEWSNEAVRKLIAIRIPMENAFSMFKRYVILWQYVASQMEKGGFNPTYNECSIRWMELCESFKLCSETLTRRGNDIEVDWTFYQEMRQGYEQNNRKTDTVVDYRCRSVDLSTENSTEATTFASTGNSESFTDSEDSSCSRGSSSEKMSGIDDLETEESLASISREESNISEETEASDTNLKEHSDYGIAESNCFRVWNEEATLLLINLKLIRESEFRNRAIPETDLWKMIATDMQSAGHNVSHQACAERWHQVKAAYENNVAPKGGDLALPKPPEHPNPLLDDEKPQEVDRINPPKFVWTDEAVRTLVKLRFSEKMKDVRKYGAPIAAIMRAKGYPAIAPTDVSRKWSRIISTYRKASCRYNRGETVRWQYFELLDGYMKGLPNPEESIKAQTQLGTSMMWTPRSAKKLIETKLSLDTSFSESDLRTSSSLWEEVSGAMKAEGYSVTAYHCAAEWNLLIGAYNSTKKKVGKGDAVIGKYYVMVDEAINKIIGSETEITKEVEPIDFSIPGKRKMNEEPEGTVAKRAKMEEPIDLNVINLSQKNESSNMKMGVENESNKANERSKESVDAFVKMEALHRPGVKNEDSQLRILCDQKPCRLNTMIQDKAVNSTEDVNGRWSESATQLLIDLKSQHHRQYPLLPRPEIQWEKVAALLGRLGYNYTAVECSIRWNFLKTMYERRIADYGANGAVQPWTYFDRLEAIYKKRDGLGTILPKKRARDEDEELPLSKRLTVTLLPMGETQISPPEFKTLNTAEVEIEMEKQNE